MLDAAAFRESVKSIGPSHVFYGTWQRRPTEPENIEVNSAMIQNLLDALSPGKTVKHVALVTGLKHYLGPFEMYAKSTPLPTPFRESQPRLNVENFYYDQEDVLYAAANRDGFT
ncbi:hypothetical protein ALQ62_00788 [Pseudomonas coronafaciens pv. zizaniae]|uniref:hypothetical protein n=1 Tax=Pseudomonas coronafaciens TaxID=53409 RepID=UPI000F006262|nr:hypothetical protein [Pseudomonas coronafaciens]RMN25575.1 hypothetical protein ALQ62_00788 [Pseudomonas coronafaciens pv. zizaniae]